MSILSILTPVGRPDQFLPEAGRSVAALAAALPEVTVEWVIAYDATPHVSSLGDIPGRVQVVVLPATGRLHRGPGHTRNRALEAASGEHAVALDSDDSLDVIGMAHAYETVRDTGASWIAGDTRDLSTGTALWSPPQWRPGPLPRGAFLDYLDQHGHYPIHCSATVLATGTLRSVGGWDCSATLARDEDVACLARLSERHDGWWTAAYLLHHRDNEESLTRTAPWGGSPERAHLVRTRLHDPDPSLGSYTADLAYQDAEIAALTGSAAA